MRDFNSGGFAGRNQAPRLTKLGDLDAFTRTPLRRCLTLSSEKPLSSV
jgi:hypothetical protein